jgi:hypothetical protein
MEHLVEWELVRETKKYLEKTCTSATVHHKSHMTWPGIKAGLLQWEAGDLKAWAKAEPTKDKSLQSLHKKYYTFLYRGKNAICCSQQFLCCYSQDQKNFDLTFVDCQIYNTNSNIRVCLKIHKTYVTIDKEMLLKQCWKKCSEMTVLFSIVTPSRKALSCYNIHTLSNASGFLSEDGMWHQVV